MENDMQKKQIAEDMTGRPYVPVPEEVEHTANRQVAEDLFSNREFRRLDPYAQVKQLENAYRAASKAAREAFIRKNQRSIEAGQEL